jgi:NAD-dependent oxidoreductase involved in siderophore biosynthesis
MGYWRISLATVSAEVHAANHRMHRRRLKGYGVHLESLSKTEHACRDSELACVVVQGSMKGRRSRVAHGLRTAITGN